MPTRKAKTISTNAQTTSVKSYPKETSRRAYNNTNAISAFQRSLATRAKAAGGQG